MPCPPEVLKLIEKFELHKEDYLAPSYNEAQLRQEFLDPLFEALGCWPTFQPTRLSWD